MAACRLLSLAALLLSGLLLGAPRRAAAAAPGARLHYECSPPDAEKLLSVGMHSGHNNQRWCVLAALAFAAKLNYTFVLPPWRLDYKRTQLTTCATRPFDFFYRLEPVLRYAAAHGFRVARHYGDGLDPQQLGACVQSVSAGYGGGQRYFNQHLIYGAPLPSTLCLNSKDAVLNLVRHRLLPTLASVHVHCIIIACAA